MFGTRKVTSNSSDESTQILQDHFASENAARETDAADWREFLPGCRRELTMASHPLSGVMRFSQTLLFAIFLTVPSAKAQTAKILTGVYNGKYTCAQGPTNLKLSVVVSPIGDVSALFTFYLPAEAPKQGYTYSLHGQFDQQTGKFSFTPVRWETEHAANLGMVGMEGTLSGDTLSGNITGGRCAAFSVARDKAESANIAAVITAQKNGGKPITPSSWTAQLAAAQASAQTSVTATNTAPAAIATQPPAAQTKPPAAAPPAPPNRAQGTQVASAAQRQIPPAAAQAGAKPAAATPPSETKPPNLTDPVLKWQMYTMEDPATGGSSPHPSAHTFLDTNYYTIDATVSCNQNGMSVFLHNGGTYLDLQAPALGFVWHRDEYDEWATDVVVNVDGRSHTAKGFPNEEVRSSSNGNPYNNQLGIFFYKPDLAIQQTFATERQSRIATGLDSLGSVFNTMVRKAAEIDANDAAAKSAGPLTDLLNAKSIRVEFSIEGQNKKPYLDHKPYLELNPQHPVLHKFVTECAAKMGVGTPPAKAAPPPSTMPARTQPMAK